MRDLAGVENGCTCPEGGSGHSGALQFHRSFEDVQKVLPGVGEPAAISVARCEEVLVRLEVGTRSAADQHSSELIGTLAGTDDLRLLSGDLTRARLEQLAYSDPESIGQGVQRGQARCRHSPFDLAEERLRYAARRGKTGGGQTRALPQRSYGSPNVRFHRVPDPIIALTVNCVPGQVFESDKL